MATRTLLVLATLGAAACAKHGSAGAPRPADSVQVGYGAQPREKTTGAVTALSSDDVMKGRPFSIEELLRGKVAGLEIIQTGSSVRFRIRGAASISQEQEPLVIVDDEMIQAGNIVNALAGLTPSDIKQVAVLKDVASTSIYGGRGAGGVILITTKNKREDKND
ncbi:TonB-dependent outer membrane protein SusC/RagA, conserved site (plasmid) [Gemmatirosa kalamazoonensis]|uniref:TonB-dependent outer membrane protein SusC/RagA, conserved site n=1 Tax=Gemmatirosa kalamazoonensis TaxID=861299 RepID=W0RPX4_9BACT|nr:TonB-dependent receptor plug domain-containing protein [Gemmatirosa kalamazoonensis]AHG92390.1 TonB-dependent outer membrane protein SusC/RagA, conserved site [Gemmatirosa kalamazoonensis]